MCMDMAICLPVLGWDWEQEGSWCLQATSLSCRHRVLLLPGMEVTLAVRQLGLTMPGAGIRPRGLQPASSRVSTGCAVAGT